MALPGAAAEPEFADGLNSLVEPSKPPTGRSRKAPWPGGPIEGVLAKRPTLGALVEPTPTDGTLRTLGALAGLAAAVDAAALAAVSVASFGASSVAPWVAALEARDEVERSGAGDGDATAAAVATAGESALDPESV